MLPPKGRFLLDFYADWCRPCKAMVPVVEQAIQETGVTLVKIDVDTEPDAVTEYGVKGMPTFVVIDNGKEVARKTGVMTKDQLVELLSP